MLSQQIPAAAPLGIASEGTQEGGGCSLFFHIVLLNSPGFAYLAALL